MKWIGWAAGIAVAVFILTLLPEEQGVWMSALLSFACGSVGMILGTIADEVTR